MCRCSPSSVSWSRISSLARCSRKGEPMFGNLGFTEIAILLLILVLFFGAKRIPEIGASIGKGIKEFKRGLKEEPQEREGPPSDAYLPTGSAGGGGGAPKRLNHQ